ncbi:MAG TPA: hypothetical protein VK453_19420 [Micromonosporaceae bacterium]|nr:hypothetical protein [Micromonosporaceae bacterium]
MKVRRPKMSMLAGAAIAMGGVAAFALPAGAAVSLQSESPPVSAVELGGQARIDANGAVVFAPITVVCRPGTYVSLTVSVTQAAGNAIASGTTYREVTGCTGAPQGLSISVTPTQRPFQRGIAFGRAELNVCTNSGGCTTVADEHNIRLRP